MVKKSAQQLPVAILSLAISYIILVILFFLEYNDLALSDITSSAAGFYTFFYFYKYGTLIVIAFVAAILAIVKSENTSQRFLAIYAIVLNILLTMPMHIAIYFVFRELAWVCIPILAIPAIVCVCYRKISSKKSPGSHS